MSVQNISPCGFTTAVAYTTTASSSYVTSLQPVNKWYIVNTGTSPCMVRFNGNLSATVTAAIPVPGTRQLGVFINGAADAVVTLPQALNGDITGGGPFTSNVQVSVITNGSSGNVYLTPVINV